MPAPALLAAGLRSPIAVRARPASGDVVVAERRGVLLSVDLTTGVTTPLTTLPGRVAAFDLSADGQVAYAGGNRWGLAQAALDGSPPVRRMRNAGRPGAVLVADDGGSVLVAEGRRPGSVVRLTLSPARRDQITTGVPTARGLLHVASSDEVLVAATAAGGQLLGSDRSVLVDALGQVVDIAWQAGSDHLVVVADAAGRRVVQVDLDHPGDSPTTLCDGLDGLWGARPLPDGRLVIGAGDAVHLLDAPAPVPRQVDLHVPAGRLFIGGWVQVGVTINDASLTFDDLDFVVTPDDGGELVSRSRDNGFDPQAPTVLLTAGWLTGAHELAAVRRADGATVGLAQFEVRDTWTDPRWGPSVATFGPVMAGPDSGTWGGPDSGDFSVPQNVAVHRTVGTFTVGVVLVETSQANAQYPANVGPIVQGLRDELVDGVTVGGVTRSVAEYFRQASADNLTVDVVGPVGPVRLPNAWASYFTMNAQNRWVYNEDLDSIVIAAIVANNAAAQAAGAPPFLDLTTLDTILYVVRSRPASPGVTRLSVWPRASLTKKAQIIGTTTIPLPLGGELQVPRMGALARAFMPDDWATAPGSGRAFHETATHELAHNFGLVDQYDKTGYSADATARITGGSQPAASNPTGASDGTWELMTWEESLPLPSAAHRLMLGWLPPDRVRLFNFGVSGPVDATVDLHAAGAGPVPSGRFGAAEVRVQDGLNLYLEYRPTVAGRTVDTQVPQADAVVLTEALTRQPAPTDRPQILLAKDDLDAVVERGSFVTGEDYRERDTSLPGFEEEFIVDVVGTAPDVATVRVRYAPDLKPDPAITPWIPAANWQSPDFEVVNGRSEADPRFRNVPWEGQPNRLRVRVHNHGTSDAHDVRVAFFAKDFTLGTGAETPLGEASATIGAKTSVVLEVPWTPAALTLPFGSMQYRQHSCVVARIAQFLDPVTGLQEVTPENNEAQSNYTWMATTSRSPATREVTTLLLENPWDRPAVMSVPVRQPHPLFRVYLDHAWVRLEPGESARVLMMVESLLGDDRYADLVSRFEHGERLIETNVRVSMLGDDLSACAPELVGGASVMAVTGLATRFEGFETDGGLARGVVMEEGSGDPVGGRVIVAVNPVDPDAGEPGFVVEGELFDGEFRVEHGRTEQGRWRFTAFYLGQFPWSPCESDTIAP